MNGISERIVAHILTYNHVVSIDACVRSALTHAGIDSNEIELWITDNASRDGSADKIRLLKEEFPHLSVLYNSQNMGFCAANNAAITRFLKSAAEYFLVLNPDVALTAGCIAALRATLQRNAMAGSATPKLLRCDQNLQPLAPRRIDAAGMVLTRELRHFDRGSGEEDQGQFERAGFVFGGTGACLMLRRALIEDLALPKVAFHGALADIFPSAKAGLNERTQIFDEAFFAYREDADLAWRAQRYGWRCCYVPQAIAYHTRAVVPERRSALPQALNRHGVRNRFLLQLNHYSPCTAWGAFIEGFVVRNLLVLAGVVLRERSSLGAFRELLYLAPRALKLRRAFKARATNSVSPWFKHPIE